MLRIFIKHFTTTTHHEWTPHQTPQIAQHSHIYTRCQQQIHWAVPQHELHQLG